MALVDNRLHVEEGLIIILKGCLTFIIQQGPLFFLDLDLLMELNKLFTDLLVKNCVLTF